MRHALTTVLPIALLVAFGCGQAEEAEAVVDETAQTPELAVPDEAPPDDDLAEDVEVTAEQVPLAEDFGDEAEAEVNADNYEAALAELEAELDSEAQ